MATSNNHNTRITAIVITLFVFTALFLSSNVSHAANLKDAFLTPLYNASGQAGYGKEVSAEGIASLVITIALTFIGVIFLVLAIYGGYIWMIARGNEQEVEKAKQIIQNSIIGLIVVLAAYAASWYIIKVLGDVALNTPE